MKEWSNVVILRILRNEKYCGDLIQKKTYTPDYLSHKKKINLGQEEYVILRDHHEPIISRETFEKAQKELARRSLSGGQKIKYSSRYGLSGKIQCGCCGSQFVSRVKKRKDGSRYQAWRCYQAVRYGRLTADKTGKMVSCAVSQQISNENFMRMLQMIVQHLRCDKEQLISELEETIRLVLSVSGNEEMDIGRLEQKMGIVEGKKERLLDLYLGQDISQEEYCRTFKRYEAEAEALREKIEEAGKQKMAAANQKEKAADIVAVVRALASGEIQDETFYRYLVERITVHSREYIEIKLHFLPCKWSYVLIS